jgi:hypothetical protein
MYERGGQPGRLPASVAAMKPLVDTDSASDPFGERVACPFSSRAEMLGGVFEFETNALALLRLVESAYAGLPAQAFSDDPPHFRIRLLLSDEEGPPVGDEAPPVRLHSGPGLLCGTLDAANFAIVSPAQRSGLVAVSRNMLGHAHTVRYELIEFAVYTLAARAQGLVSLHAACVGHKQQAILLVGEGGAGKSTLALHCLLREMELVAEDAVFVDPETLLACGIANFLHLRADSLMFLQPGDDAWIRSSPVIRRRSGVEKFEIDLRRTRFRLPRTPLKIACVMFLAHERAPGSLLVPLQESELLERLQANQPYAANQPVWATFTQQISSIPAFELRRGQHPSEAVAALLHIIR